MKYPLVQYILENSATFLEAPFNEADSLVLSTIPYSYLEKGPLGTAREGERIPLPLAICGIPYAELFGNMWIASMGGPEFVGALLQSPRFSSIQVSDCACAFSEDEEIQFAAMTFHLPNDITYVAFRGTDASIAGWKEDFNLSFMERIPSQECACTYLEGIAAATEGPLYVGGHSKGGNLSEFAALSCSEAAYERVERVYSFDGPGFAFAPSERIESCDYQTKLHKVVPGSSVVGMLMEGRNNLRIVKATGLLLIQHAATRWEVRDGDFVDLESLSPEVRPFDAALYSWTEMSDPAQREHLVEALFGIVAATNIEEWGDLASDPVAHVPTALKAAGDLPPEVRSALADMARYLVKASVKNSAKPHFALDTSQIASFWEGLRAFGREKPPAPLP